MKLLACATVTCCVSFEIQELPDVIRVIVLLNLSKGKRVPKSALKRRIDRVCAGYTCIEMNELDKALKEMTSEGLITEHDSTVQLTKQGKTMPAFEKRTHHGDCSWTG